MARSNFSDCTRAQGDRSAAVDACVEVTSSFPRAYQCLHLSHGWGEGSSVRRISPSVYCTKRSLTLDGTRARVGGSLPQKQEVMAQAWNACTKMVEAATRSCSTPPPTTAPTAAQPNWDAIANSFASLSVALTWGTILLAIGAVVAGVAWGKHIARTAENEARTEARRCAEQFIQEWLSRDAPGIIRSHVDNLRNATLGDGNDDAAADALGEAAG